MLTLTVNSWNNRILSNIEIRRNTAINFHFFSHILTYLLQSHIVCYVLYLQNIKHSDFATYYFKQHAEIATKSVENSYVLKFCTILSQFHQISWLQNLFIFSLQFAEYPVPCILWPYQDWGGGITPCGVPSINQNPLILKF